MEKSEWLAIIVISLIVVGMIVLFIALPPAYHWTASFVGGKVVTNPEKCKLEEKLSDLGWVEGIDLYCRR